MKYPFPSSKIGGLISRLLIGNDYRFIQEQILVCSMADITIISAR